MDSGGHSRLLSDGSGLFVSQGKQHCLRVDCEIKCDRVGKKKEKSPSQFPEAWIILQIIVLSELKHYYRTER